MTSNAANSAAASKGWTFETTVSFGTGQKGRKHLRGADAGARRAAAKRPAVVPGRVPRVSRLLALAHRFEGLLRSGAVKSQAELADLAGVSRPRMTQIMNLLLLAPDIQEEVLFLPRERSGGVMR